MTNAIRISLTEKDGETKGSISIQADGPFFVEAMAEVVKQYAAKTGVSEQEICTDI